MMLYVKRQIFGIFLLISFGTLGLGTLFADTNQSNANQSNTKLALIKPTTIKSITIKPTNTKPVKVKSAHTKFANTKPVKAKPVKTYPFKLGIENISPNFVKQCAGKKIGLITNQSGVDQAGQRTAVLLVKKGFSVSYLFAPEHGYDGNFGAGECVANAIDPQTKIPIVSLYDHAGRMIPKKIMDDIDIIMFDIQDCGMRHYTNISMLLHSMRIAEQNNKHFVVFDRPNPLGSVMEGPLVDDGLRSFISIASVPVRHGMTIGELATLFNKHELKTPINLSVIKMRNHNRRVWPFKDIQTPLSSGLRTLRSCQGYSFLGLLGEFSPFGIGLRTEGRFQCITLPNKLGISDSVWDQLQIKLKKLGLDTVRHTYEDPKSGTDFKGLRLAIKDINKAQSFTALYTILVFFAQKGVKISSAKTADLAVGIRDLRELLEGKKTHSVLIDKVNRGLNQFSKKANSFFMYRPFPAPQLMV